MGFQVILESAKIDSRKYSYMMNSKHPLFEKRPGLFPSYLPLKGLLVRMCVRSGWEFARKFKEMSSEISAAHNYSAVLPSLMFP